MPGNVLEGDTELHLVQPGHEGVDAEGETELPQWLDVPLSHTHLPSVKKLQQHPAETRFAEVISSKKFIILDI